MVVIHTVCAIGTAIGVGIVRYFAELRKLEVVGIPWLVGTAVCDVLITAALSLHLVCNSCFRPLLVSLTVDCSENIEQDLLRQTRLSIKSLGVSIPL